jgi:hypothetical protein
MNKNLQTKLQKEQSFALEHSHPIMHLLFLLKWLSKTLKCLSPSDYAYQMQNAFLLHL